MKYGFSKFCFPFVAKREKERDKKRDSRERYSPDTYHDKKYESRRHKDRRYEEDTDYYSDKEKDIRSKDRDRDYERRYASLRKIKRRIGDEEIPWITEETIITIVADMMTNMITRGDLLGHRVDLILFRIHIENEFLRKIIETGDIEIERGNGIGGNKEILGICIIHIRYEFLASRQKSLNF